MPVSLERLIAEVEPAVITEEIIRDSIQVNGSDADAIEEKKRTMVFREVEKLVLSFKTLAKVSNLDGLHNLTKLQLDNNRITKIENITHLTNLTWLDLSFNRITKIEGLATLTKLVDLSLFNNQITTIENLETLKDLNVLSLGNNSIKQLDNVMYLRQFKNLRMVNLAGNPICSGSEYKSYVLSHIKGLIYLDYSRVQANDVAAAMEQHQDEMIELQEREESREQEEREAKERDVHRSLMREANLDGVESLLEDMVAEDADWARLQQIPGLLDCWNDTRDKFNLATDEFKVLILEQHQKKKAEHTEWLEVVHQLLRDTEGQARTLIAAFQKTMKHVKLEIQANPGDTEMLLLAPKAKLMHLKDQLLQIEMEVVEKMQALNTEFDRNYSEIVDINKGYYNTYFSQVRDLENNFFAAISQVAATMYDKYNQENSGIDNLSEGARLLLQDKDALVNALQASHDAHTGKIDGLEDRLVSQELKLANDLATANVQNEYRRNRDRVSEIINYIELSMMELDDLAGDEDGDGA